MNLRRIFLSVGAAAVVARPFAAVAQPVQKPARIGFLKFLPVEDEVELGPFRQGMRELGHVEGKTYVLEIRSADNKPERFPALADELVRLKPDVIWVTTGSGIEAVRNATNTIPVVFGAALDPVSSGFVQSLARPGGNLTGPSLMATDIAGKQLELLRELVPKLTRVAVLVSSGKAHVVYMDAVEAAAKVLALRVTRYQAATLAEAESAIAAMRRNSMEALILATGPVFQANSKAISEMGLKLRLPMLFPYASAAQNGALISYGPNLADVFRRSAAYVDKILKGRKPADLPVEQPTRFELVINGKTAKALGLKIPYSLLISAEKVIE